MSAINNPKVLYSLVGILVLLYVLAIVIPLSNQEDKDEDVSSDSPETVQAEDGIVSAMGKLYTPANMEMLSRKSSLYSFRVRKARSGEKIVSRKTTPGLHDLLRMPHSEFLSEMARRPVSRSRMEGNPVIFVPGIAGSRLNAKGRKVDSAGTFCGRDIDEQIWASASIFRPAIFGYGCWVDSMSVRYDSATQRALDCPGLTITCPAYGNTFAIHTLYSVAGNEVFLTENFATLIDTLEASDPNWVDGQNLLGSPYDWRCVNDDAKLDAYVNQFLNLIVFAYQTNGNKPVTILGHSMGCKLTQNILTRLSQGGKDVYINKVIYVAGAIGGAGSGLRGVLSGNNLGIPLLQADDVADMEATFTGLQWLKPLSEVYGNATSVTIAGQQFTFNDDQFNSMTAAKGRPGVGLQYQALSRPKQGLDLIHPGVRVEVVRPLKTNQESGVGGQGTELVYSYSNGNKDTQPTITGEIDYYRRLKAQEGGFPWLEGKAEADTRGDGTVPYLSLTVPMRFWANQAGKPQVTERVFAGTNFDHTSILSESASVQYMLGLIGPAPGGSAPLPVCTDTRNCKFDVRDGRCQVKCKNSFWGSTFWQDAEPNPNDDAGEDYCPWYAYCVF